MKITAAMCASSLKGRMTKTLTELGRGLFSALTAESWSTRQRPQRQQACRKLAPYRLTQL